MSANLKKAFVAFTIFRIDRIRFFILKFVNIIKTNIDALATAIHFSASTITSYMVSLILLKHLLKFDPSECWITFSFALSGIMPAGLAYDLSEEPEPDLLVWRPHLLRPLPLQG